MASVVAPVHGHLHHAVAGSAGAQEDLDVEAEALGPQRAEQRLCGLGREGLEAALRIGDAVEPDAGHQPVERATGSHTMRTAAD
jgi:hypothetical protein